VMDTKPFSTDQRLKRAQNKSKNLRLYIKKGTQKDLIQVIMFHTIL
jgi:hypothetical protein